MKQIIIKTLLSIVVALGSLTANAQVKAFEKYADTKNVSYVYISKYMLSMAGKNATPSVPGIDTKAPSNLTLSAEFAQFIPGISRTGSKEGSVTYVDDFEGAESSIDLKGVMFWHLASTPQLLCNTNLIPFPPVYSA